MGYILNLAGKLSVNGFDEFGFCGWIMRVLVWFSLLQERILSVFGYLVFSKRALYVFLSFRICLKA